MVGYYTTGDRMKHWGGLGAFWGGLWGLLFGAGLFLIPGIGPVLVAGPILAALVGALESALVVGGLSALTAGLVSLGIPKDQSIKYEAAVKAEVEAAGFKLDGESNILANPGDDHTKMVFDPSVRGKTDQFLLRFRKPK